MNRHSKPILCLDFDGVLHSYTSGWKGADKIPDAPVEGAVVFIASAMDYFEVHIYSSRSGQDGGIQAMQKWLVRAFEDHYQEPPVDFKSIVCDIISWPIEKPPAMVTIDDRALTFTGRWPDIEELRAFKPWNKKDI